MVCLRVYPAAPGAPRGRFEQAGNEAFVSGHDGAYEDERDTSQRVELLPPDTDHFYTSQTADWVSISPYLKDSEVRLYMILRALVIEKYSNPVRKLTLRQLCYMLPKKPLPMPGRWRATRPRPMCEPSSLSRIRSIIDALTRVGLLTTPEGERITTSSRASAAGRPLRIRINDRPAIGYDGAPNAFELLDAITAPAEAAAAAAIREEAAKAAAKRAATAAEKAGQISDPAGAGQKSGPVGQKSGPVGQKSGPVGQKSGPVGQKSGPVGQKSGPVGQKSGPVGQKSGPVGQKSGPVGQKSGPVGQKSGPDMAAGQGQPELPFSPSAQSHRSYTPPVRPSLPTGSRAEADDDGRTEGSKSAGEEGKPLSGPGVELLQAIGGEQPKFLLTGKVLHDQGVKVAGMLAEGWTPRQIAHVVAGRPLPTPITTSVGAIISARLSEALSAGQPPSAAPPIPAQQGADHDGWGDHPGARPWADGEQGISMDWVRVLPECEDCGRPTGAGRLCPVCAGWPFCTRCSLRRVDPEGAGVCEPCTDAPASTADTSNLDTTEDMPEITEAEWMAARDAAVAAARVEEESRHGA
ncbi:hypothetical protein [Streptomyces sp. FR-008]|uniref:hypothetical protein n=1 Tax=Streptomyces sp. FR-008 TaxID=206662 RepID=UPI0013315AFE|nr:hypothetical protein [Streptomyces sp. FR-008]